MGVTAPLQQRKQTSDGPDFAEAAAASNFCLPLLLLLLPPLLLLFFVAAPTSEGFSLSSCFLQCLEDFSDCGNSKLSCSDSDSGQCCRYSAAAATATASLAAVSPAAVAHSWYLSQCVLGRCFHPARSDVMAAYAMPLESWLKLRLQ